MSQQNVFTSVSLPSCPPVPSLAIHGRKVCCSVFLRTRPSLEFDSFRLPCIPAPRCSKEDYAAGFIWCFLTALMKAVVCGGRPSASTELCGVHEVLCLWVELSSPTSSAPPSMCLLAFPPLGCPLLPSSPPNPAVGKSPQRMPLLCHRACACAWCLSCSCT